MSKSEKPKSGLASFSADILWMLQPFVEYSRLPNAYRGFDAIVVEPCAEGGAIIVAVDGHAIAVFRDPNGTCSGPMTLGVPDAMFNACKPPEPICMNYCGEHYSCSLPEWAQPSTIYAYSVGAHISSKMRHPDWAEVRDDFQPALYSVMECGTGVYTVGLDYKWTSGAPLDWRAPLERALAGEVATDGIYPVNTHIQGLFTRVADRIADVRNKGASTFHRFTRSENRIPMPTLVTIEDYPNFVGVYMPQKPSPYQPPATWFQKRVGERIGDVQ